MDDDVGFVNSGSIRAGLDDNVSGVAGDTGENTMGKLVAVSAGNGGACVLFLCFLI